MAIATDSRPVGEPSRERDKRPRILAAAQQVFAEQVPSIPLFYPVYNYFVDKTVQGVSLGILFDSSSRFANVHEWYVKTKRLSQ